ncbi:MAG: hypothetical protein LBU58_11495 [Clostridiales bacterium]|jgi:D-lactate dehydrogenase|nr:hypothetical protein [Clostridiales bacterium]
MLKVLHYGSKGSDLTLIEEINRDYGLDFTRLDDSLSLANAGAAEGFPAVWISTSSKVDRNVAGALIRAGVKYIVSQAAGTDHLDIESIRESGLLAANVPDYSPSAISEYSILLALSLLRKLKPTIRRVDADNYTLPGLRGRELNTLAAGVVGAGRIGSETIRLLRGFGCGVHYHSRTEKPELSALAEYHAAPGTLYAACDILFFHCPLTRETRGMVNRETIAGMKDGVILINTARGAIFDFSAVRDAMDEGKVDALGFDVYENEFEILRKIPIGTKPGDPVFCDLVSRDNVIYAPHASFFTDKSVRAMAAGAVANLHAYLTSGRCANELT